MVGAELAGARYGTLLWLGEGRKEEASHPPTSNRRLGAVRIICKKEMGPERARAAAGNLGWELGRASGLGLGLLFAFRDDDGAARRVK